MDDCPAPCRFTEEDAFAAAHLQRIPDIARLCGEAFGAMSEAAGRASSAFTGFSAACAEIEQDRLALGLPPRGPNGFLLDDDY